MISVKKKTPDSITKKDHNYLQEAKELNRARDAYRERCDVYNKQRLGLEMQYAVTAPLAQKPVTEKLEEQNKEKISTSVFDNIISSYGGNVPAFSIRIHKNVNGYFLGSIPISLVLKEGQKYVKIKEREFLLTAGVESLLSFSNRITKKEVKEMVGLEDLKLYKSIIETANNASYTNGGLYKNVIKILESPPLPPPPPPPETVGEGLKVARLPLLLSAKKEGHNNVDEEIREIVGKKKY